MSGAIVLLLAVIFVIAAIAKLRSRDAFRAILRGVFPKLLVEPLAVVVPAAELALAVFLLSGIKPHVAVACAIAMLALFTIILTEMWWRGIKGCACFGETVNNATTGSGIVRNAILMVAAAFAVNDPGPVTFWGPDIASLLGRLTVVVGALCLWSGILALANQRQIFANNFNNLP